MLFTPSCYATGLMDGLAMMVQHIFKGKGVPKFNLQIELEKPHI